MTDFSQARIETVIQGLRPMDGSNEMDAGVTLIGDMSDEIERLQGVIDLAYAHVMSGAQPSCVGLLAGARSTSSTRESSE